VRGTVKRVTLKAEKPENTGKKRSENGLKVPESANYAGEGFIRTKLGRRGGKPQ